MKRLLSILLILLSYTVSAQFCPDLGPDQFVSECPSLIYYIPNAFTPDGDAYNQTWQPVFTKGFDPNDYHMTIFNRWGEILWESYDASVGWDGTYKGSVIQTGTYVWKVEFGDSFNDSRHMDYGTVTILR
jgi:gliding motility-associated-like protein